MLLPSTLPRLAGVQIAGAWQPAREVGGDYFDVIQLDKDRLGICVGEAARARQGSALEVQRAIMQQVTAFCGGNFGDDATLLVLRIS